MELNEDDSFNQNIPQSSSSIVLEKVLDICNMHNTSFISVNRNDLIGFSYRGCDYRIFTDEIRCWMRGLCIDAKSGKIVIRGIRKFYNFGECPNPGFSFFNSDGSLRKFHMLEKYDGSLVCTNYFNERLYVTMKTGETDATYNVRQFIASSPINYNALIQHMSQNGYTTCFEYIDPKRPIVIHYNQEQLVFIAAVNNQTGRSITYDELVQLSIQFNIPYARCLDIDMIKLRLSNGEINEDKFITEFKALINSTKNIEGYIMWFEDEIYGNNERYKFKTNDYFNSSKVYNTILGKHYALWELILSSFLTNLGQIPKKHETKKPNYIGEPITINLDDIRHIAASSDSSFTIGHLANNIDKIIDETFNVIWKLLQIYGNQPIKNLRNNSNPETNLLVSIFKNDHILTKAKSSENETRIILLTTLHNSCVSRATLLKMCRIINPDLLTLFEKHEHIQWEN